MPDEDTAETTPSKPKKAKKKVYLNTLRQALMVQLVDEKGKHYTKWWGSRAKMELDDSEVSPDLEGLIKRGRIRVMPTSK